MYSEMLYCDYPDQFKEAGPDFINMYNACFKTNLTAREVFGNFQISKSQAILFYSDAEHKDLIGFITFSFTRRPFKTVTPVMHVWSIYFKEPALLQKHASRIVTRLRDIGDDHWAYDLYVEGLPEFEPILDESRFTKKEGHSLYKFTFPNY